MLHGAIHDGWVVELLLRINCSLRRVVPHERRAKFGKPVQTGLALVDEESG